MQAVTNTEYGTPDVLHLAEVPHPAVGPHDVLIQVHASTVTQGDRRLRAADYPGVTAPLGRLFSGVFRPRHPIGGSNFAGRVVRVGAKVTRFAPGDDVFGSTMHGAYAQYLAVSETSPIAKMPRSKSYAESATLPYGGTTALTFLRDMAQVKPGQRVLVVGAAGGVGRMGIQVAKHLGAHVTGVCGAGAAHVLALGADEVIDYRAQDFTQLGRTWDVIFDTTEGDHFRAYRSALVEDGCYLSLYLTPRVVWEMLLGSLFGGKRALAGVAMGDADSIQDLSQLADAGALHEVIAARFRLADAAAAHAHLEHSRPHGSIVVEVIESEEFLLAESPHPAPAASPFVAALAAPLCQSA